MAWTCPSCDTECFDDALLRCVCGHEIMEGKNQDLYNVEKELQEHYTVANKLQEPINNEEIINKTSSFKSKTQTTTDFINNYTAKETSYKFSISLFWASCLLLICFASVGIGKFFKLS